MNEALSYIDDFFRGNPGPMAKQEFEKRLKEDPAFAEEVAFYVATINVLKDDAKAERKERYRNFKSDESSEEASEATNVRPMRSSRRLSWTYAAAASVLILLTVGWFMFGDRATPVEMADQYAKENFIRLSVEMGDSRDSLKDAIELYNDGKLNDALKIFLALSRNDSVSFEAKKNAGIVYYRLGEYDQALGYFKQVENYVDEYANPGLFYQALTLLKRNQEGDQQLARQMLQQVVDKDLEEKKTAVEWLKKLEP